MPASYFVLDQQLILHRHFRGAEATEYRFADELNLRISISAQKGTGNDSIYSNPYQNDFYQQEQDRDPAE